MSELQSNQANPAVQSDDPTDHISTDPSLVKGAEYEKNTLNPEDLSDRWLRWKCLKCGFVYEGQRPLNVCPRCGNDDPDLFDDAS
jgi:Zn finger protein HypA/HybF involved in hydrogenase expression